MRRPGPAPNRPVRTTPRAVEGESSSATTSELRRFGRRYPAVGRAVVSVPCAAAAPFATPPDVRIAAVAAAGVVGWNVLYLATVLPDGTGRARLGWTLAVDLVLLCGLCLAQPVLVDPELLAASLGWVSPIASFTVVAVQFQLRSRLAIAATLGICLAFVAGAAASPGLTVRDGLIAGGAWMVVEAVLARLLWRRLLRGGREADRLLGAGFAAERAAVTAAARRADQRAHWATVHDTSASTLLMIGLGEVTGTEEWLSGRLRRDIAVLDGSHDDDADEVDVGAALRAAGERARLRVLGPRAAPGAAAAGLHADGRADRRGAAGRPSLCTRDAHRGREWYGGQRRGRRGNPRRRGNRASTGRNADADVVVFDLLLDDGVPAFHALARLVEAGRRVVVYSQSVDNDSVLHCVELGVATYLTKTEGPEHLIPALRAAAHDRPYISPALGGAMAGDRRADRPAVSDREREVLLAWFESDSKNLVAARFGLSVNTVETYIGRVRIKYAEVGRPATTKAALVARALQDGLVDLSEL